MIGRVLTWVLEVGWVIAWALELDHGPQGEIRAAAWPERAPMSGGGALSGAETVPEIHVAPMRARYHDRSPGSPRIGGLLRRPEAGRHGRTATRLVAP